PSIARDCRTTGEQRFIMVWKSVKEFVIGKAKNPFDPAIFRRISLVALLAWVGLGADGLSSSCYGPEEAFVALNGHGFLAIYLAVATALTVAIISLSYTQIIEQFPFGGGGYLVATKLISPSAGLVAGSALVIDYIMTIAVSVASGIDALFSFLPYEYQSYKLVSSIIVVGILILLNLRGAKESITILLPIFAAFIITHLIMLIAAISQNAYTLPGYFADTVQQTRDTAHNMGIWVLLMIILKSYSHGAGTYTGIEAVSNALPTLQEPKAETGKKTMLYMALSLALLSGGLLIFYGIFGVAKLPGKTLNATLFEGIIQHWHMPMFVGSGLLILTLISEATLLFVAAQTGFIGGPQVLANMALDYWMPKRLTHLSERLTIYNGILFMGLGSVAIILATGGSVAFLVVLYSINVFITFSLSQFGMCRHGLKIKNRTTDWRSKFIINLVGFLLTTAILIILVGFKFMQGGWLTLVITSSFILVAMMIKRHYINTRKALKRLDDILVNMPRPERLEPIPETIDKDASTAVILVSSYNGFGIHTFFSVEKLFPKMFKRYVFIGVGELDMGQFKGIKEVENLRADTLANVKKYVEMANDFGFYAEYRHDVSVNLLETLVELCNKIAAEYPKTVFFVSKLVFKNENFFTNILHNETAFRLQRRLALEGKQTAVMPIRVY
ncbi:MAG: APC family permease, partial [Planctomycetota bacterium]